MRSGRLPTKDCNQSEEMDIVIFGYAGRLSAEGHNPLLFRKCFLGLNLVLASYPYTLTVKCPFSSKTNAKSDVWLTVHRNSVWIRKTN